MELRFGGLTVSDRSARGERLDLSGPALVQEVEKQGWKIINTGIVRDDYQELINIITEWVDTSDMDIVLTTGGTGFSPRDVTPEATKDIVERAAPGLVELMRAESLKITPYAALSRAYSGIRGHTLIINLPGSPKAAVENLNFVASILPHAVQLLREDSDAESGHFFSK
jgi:molybdenum cofactor synthesis domain-containing protein